MNPLQTIGTLLALLLLAASPASAEIIVNYHSTGFGVSTTSQDIKVCSCDTATEYITISNEGNFPASYSLALSTQFPKEWASLGSSELSLNPGERATIPLFIDAPCLVRGAWPYAITITSSHGREQTLVRTLQADQCQNIQILVEQEKPSVNLCEEQNYLITIRNVAGFTDEYTLSTGPYEPFTNIKGPATFKLQTGESIKLHASLELPCTYEENIYDIPFIVSTAKNANQGQVIVPLDVQNKIDYSLQVETSENFCGRVPSKMPIMIGNYNTRENTYNIELAGPDYITLEQDQVSVPAGERGVIVANIVPGREHYGSSDLTIVATSEIGHITKSRTVQINIDACYEHEVSFQGELSGKENTNEQAVCGYREYLLNIRNNGAESETFQLERTGPSWMQLTRESVTLQPSENINVIIEADIPCTDQTYDFTFTAANARQPHIIEEVSLNLHAMSREAALNIELLQDEFVINEDTPGIALLVRQTGIAGGTYDLTLDSELFELEESTLTIYPGEEKVLNLRTSKDLRTYLEGRYLSDLEFLIDFENNGVLFSRQFGAEYDQKSWFTRMYETHRLRHF
ncbi:MAG: hypothetical protein HC945_02785, partial [Nitrosarchaeum sp.]|nr:hypothetical protein [Nitrosarchaeum sp.]